MGRMFLKPAQLQTEQNGATGTDRTRRRTSRRGSTTGETTRKEQGGVFRMSQGEAVSLSPRGRGLRRGKRLSGGRRSLSRVQ
jgi:hypothetical protein